MYSRSNKLRRWWYKITHWEYLPVEIVYLPTFLRWVVRALRFGEFRFYQHSNPSIKNGGLHGVSKWSIYQLLPPATYPKTVLIQAGKSDDFEQILLYHQLQFPLIVKPDKGLRGIGVARVHDMTALEKYARETAQDDFLLQELCTYPNEMGLFYARLPNQAQGQITGITLKVFLTVKGDGVHTIEELLWQNPRFSLQVEKLRSHTDLSQVLPLNAERCLVPFGNHNRGTMFLDGSSHITPPLVAYFDHLLSQVAGFYYGRLDIRYDTIEKLAQGIDFSIIELNGAMSEPTHIYDPKHSFFYGQKEISRHQDIFMKIIEINKKLAK